MQRNHYNKNIYFFICLLSLCVSVNAQYPTIREKVQYLDDFDDKLFHWGYVIGLNQFGYRIEYENNPLSTLRADGKVPEIFIEQQIGFGIGFVMDYRYNENINFRIEPGFYNSNSVFNFPDPQRFANENDLTREVKANWLHVPFLVKYSALRINNFRNFIVTGLSIFHNLSSGQKGINDNSTGMFRVKSFSANFEVGFGFEFYLFYFKIIPSFRGVFGLSNTLVKDNDPNSLHTGTLTGLYPQGFVFNLTFE